MLVRWNERPMPRRQTSCGATPVMSRPSRTTAPASGRRWPVMRLKTVVLPAPLGPMMAAVWPWATVRLTPATAWKPSNALRRSRTSSTPGPPEPPRHDLDGAADAAQERHDEDLGGLGPVREVGKDAAVEDPEQAAGQPRERAGQHEGRQLIAPHVDADE